MRSAHFVLRGEGYQCVRGTLHNNRCWHLCLTTLHWDGPSFWSYHSHYRDQKRTWTWSNSDSHCCRALTGWLLSQVVWFCLLQVPFTAFCLEVADASHTELFWCLKIMQMRPWWSMGCKCMKGRRNTFSVNVRKWFEVLLTAWNWFVRVMNSSSASLNRACRAAPGQGCREQVCQTPWQPELC